VIVSDQVNEIAYSEVLIPGLPIQSLQQRDFTQPYVSSEQQQKTKISVYTGNPFRNKEDIKPLIIVPQWMKDSVNSKS